MTPIEPMEVDPVTILRRSNSMTGRYQARFLSVGAIVNDEEELNRPATYFLML
jgi:hypothetical protein